MSWEGGGSRFHSIALAGFTFFISAGIGSAAASACMFAGPHYRLTSDSVNWSLKIANNGNCSFDFRRNTILSSSPNGVDIERLQVMSPPQSGQVTIKDTGLTYTAK